MEKEDFGQFGEQRLRRKEEEKQRMVELMVQKERKDLLSAFDLVGKERRFQMRREKRMEGEMGDSLQRELREVLLFH